MNQTGKRKLLPGTSIAFAPGEDKDLYGDSERRVLAMADVSLCDGKCCNKHFY